MSTKESASWNRATVIAVDMGGGKQSVSIQKDVSPTLATTHYGEPVVCYPVENHPNDSRVKISQDGNVQTLSTRMGTGGGNVPLVLLEVRNE